MESRILEGVVTALSSISHNGGQSFGVTSKLRREKFVQPDGTTEDVPVLSGNGLRGLLRDVGMLQMCRAIGYGQPDSNGVPLGLTLPAFYFLFSGGTLTSAAGKGLDIDLARRLRAMIPLVSVFGGAMGNQIMPGRLKVGKCIPICAETAHLIPERFIGDRVIAPIWDYLQEEMYTRKDDEKNEHLRTLMAPSTLRLMDQQRQVKAIKADANLAQDDTGEHQQMRYFVETFAAGTQFYWYLVLDDASDVEFEALITTLVEFSKKPFVGGKSGTGLGKVAVQFDQWFSITPHIDHVNRAALDVPLGTRYSEHLRTSGAMIRTLLGAMS